MTHEIETIRRLEARISDLTGRLEIAEAERDVAIRQRDEAVAALRPFYAAVFNDNGDVTIDQSHLRTQDWLKLSATFRNIKETRDDR